MTTINRRTGLDLPKHAARDFISISVAKGITGPADMLASDWPDHGYFRGRIRDKAALAIELNDRPMDDVDQEIADYLSSGGTIKLGRGFSKAMTVAPLRKRVKPPKKKVPALDKNA